VTERRQRRVRFPVAIGSSDDSPIFRRVELDGEEGGTEESWKAGRCMPVDGTRRPWHQSEEGRWQSRWCLGHKGDQSLATCEIFFLRNRIADDDHVRFCGLPYQSYASYPVRGCVCLCKGCNYVNCQ
jgi:hypothetical protein